MVVYRCFQCGREVKPEHIKRKVRCPYCGCRILYKVRPNKVKVVKAR